VGTETDTFMAWLRMLDIDTIIKELRESHHEIRKAELTRSFNKMPDLKESDKQEIEYLTERIAKKLREQELVCRTLAVKIRYSDFTSANRSRSLAYPSDDSNALFKMVNTLFNELQLRRIRLRHVGVAATNIEPRNLQASLFSERSRRESLNTTIDEIREKFGFMSILPAETIELKRKYRMEPSGYVLHNPALTR